MPERWLCKRCYTSADESVTTCRNCGLARGEVAPSPFAFTELPEDAAAGATDAEADEGPEVAMGSSIGAPAQPEIVWQQPPYVPTTQAAPVVAAGPPTACARCGSPIFAQWWDPTKGGYECRRCGALTKGAPPAGALKSRSGCFLGCAGIFAALAVLGAITGDFSVGVGLMAFAGLIALAGVLTSRRRAQ